MGRGAERRVGWGGEQGGAGRGSAWAGREGGLGGAGRGGAGQWVGDIGGAASPSFMQTVEAELAEGHVVHSRPLSHHAAVALLLAW